MQKVVESYNEWDPLEEVIVGTVTGAMYPEVSPILAANGEPEWLLHYQGEFVEEEFIEKANEQLENLVALFEDANIKVRRPAPHAHNVEYQTPNWRCRSGWNTANPRDLFLVVGDEVIECASPLRHRYFESQAYHSLMTQYFKQGARWTAAPKAPLRDSLYDHSFLLSERSENDSDADKILQEGETHRYPINESEPVFEAADFVRCGKDLFVTQSIATNALGIEWVRRHLGDRYRVHEIKTRCKATWHIDTTFMPLAPKKALINPQWVHEVPDALKDWDLRAAPMPSYLQTSPMAHPYFTSQWLSMNVFSIDEKRVCVDAQQVDMIHMLREWGFTPIAIPFDYVGMFGGSFHCVTLDIKRKGTLQSYCEP